MTADRSSRARVCLAQRRAEFALLKTLTCRVLPAVRLAKSSGTAPFIAWLQAHASRSPDALCWELDGERLTFGEALSGARQAATVLVAAGVRPGDVVALMGGNSPRYLQLIMAINYAGAAAALINPDLTQEPLAHALKAVKPCVSLIENACRRAISLLESPDLAGTVLEFGPGELDQRQRSAAELTHARADPEGDFVFIFTSGTTGLPKACRVRHSRARSAATIFGSVAFDFRAGDKLYCALPLHHSSALLVGVGAALVAGVPVALRRKFSVREFCDDLRRYHATATLYVGDICRALVHGPKSPEERTPRLRVAVGNGLEPAVWSAFAEQFGYPVIREFYAATEAPAAILNLTGTVGSVGHVPFERRRGFRLLRLDSEGLELARDARGRALVCACNEPGELLLRIFPRPGEPLGAFAGYMDERASNARIARDVFEPGDCYFRSGDVLRRDRYGYYYFVDRLGDGFRWKGENVSALQVEGVLSAGCGFAGVAVFGVAVPGYPGRAGVARVVTEGAFDAIGFARAARGLPVYARPCFVEPVSALPTTSSYKIQKRDFDLTAGAAREALWVRQNDAYVVLTAKLWDDLCSGQARL